MLDLGLHMYPVAVLQSSLYICFTEGWVVS